MRIIYLFLIICTLSGCAGIPAIVLQAVSAADVVSGITTGKTAASSVMSEVKGQDCVIYRMFKGKKVCQDQGIEDLIDLGCDIYAWDEENKVYCKKENTKQVHNRETTMKHVCALIMLLVVLFPSTIWAADTNTVSGTVVTDKAPPTASAPSVVINN